MTKQEVVKLINQLFNDADLMKYLYIEDVYKEEYRMQLIFKKKPDDIAEYIIIETGSPVAQ